MTPTPAPTRPSHHTGQWGLAGLLLALAVVLFFPLMCFLLAGAMTAVANDDYLETRDIGLGVLAVQLLAGGVLVLAAFGLLCGVVGVVSGLVRRQPLGLAVAGVVASLAAVTFAVVLLVATLRCVEWTVSYQAKHFGPDGKRSYTTPTLPRP
jgi:hypothetical protein